MCRSFSEWWERFPGDVDRVFNAASMAAANIGRRQQRPLAAPTWQLMTLDDELMPACRNYAIARDFALAQKCDLREGFERRYWQAVQDSVQVPEGSDRLQAVHSSCGQKSTQFPPGHSLHIMPSTDSQHPCLTDDASPFLRIRSTTMLRFTGPLLVLCAVCNQYYPKRVASVWLHGVVRQNEHCSG